MLPVYATIKKRINRLSVPPPDYTMIQTNSARFDNGKFFMDGHELFRLERPIVYCLNNRDLIRCCASSQGILCIFQMPIDDVIYLNSLLYQLVILKDVKHGHVHYLRQAADKRNSAEHFHYDKETRVFNRLGQELYKSDFIKVFNGRVAMSIKGIRVIDGYHIYLEAYIYQVKIEEEEDVQVNASGDCIFD